MASVIEIRTTNPLDTIINRLRQLEFRSIFLSTVIVIEQVNEDRYEFWVRKKTFGVFSKFYDFAGQLILMETEQTLIQLRTDAPDGLEGVFYVLAIICTLGTILSLNEPTLLIAIISLCLSGFIWHFWLRSRNQFANELLKNLTR